MASDRTGLARAVKQACPVEDVARELVAAHRPVRGAVHTVPRGEARASAVHRRSRVCRRRTALATAGSSSRCGPTSTTVPFGTPTHATHRGRRCHGLAVGPRRARFRDHRAGSAGCSAAIRARLRGADRGRRGRSARGLAAAAVRADGVVRPQRVPRAHDSCPHTRSSAGCREALPRRAEEVFADESHHGSAGPRPRRVFTRLVTLGEGTEDTRRRVKRSELGDAPDVEVVHRCFGAVRLLAFDRDPATREPTVEVAHEALIREWPRLRWSAG